MNRSPISPVLVLFLAIPFRFLAAQQPQGSVSGWLGFVVDSQEDRWPVSPQLGLRIEGTIEGHVWLGLESSARFINERLPCVLIDPCPFVTLMRTDEVKSVFIRVEFGGDDIRPYAFASLGRDPRGYGRSSRVIGAALGLRWSRLIGPIDLSVEMRHRDDDRFVTIETDLWDLMVGLHWTFPDS
jgi:hypothetical protein